MVLDRLLEHLASLARAQGIWTFDAYVLAGNRRMLDVFRDSGFAMTTVTSAGSFVSLSPSVTPAFEAKAATRSWSGATASMKAFFKPRGVAVIGANRERANIRVGDSPQPGDGTLPRSHVPAEGYADGPWRLKTFSSLIHASPIFPTPSPSPSSSSRPLRSPTAVDDCLARGGLPAYPLIQCGFSRVRRRGSCVRGPAARTRAGGARMPPDRLPHPHGAAEYLPPVRLNATFSPVYPPAGNVLPVHAERCARPCDPGLRGRLDIGISTFVSVGNKADVSGNDLFSIGRRPSDIGDPALSRELRQSRGGSPRSRAVSGDEAYRGGQSRPFDAGPRRPRTPGRSRPAMPWSTRCSARQADSDGTARGALRRAALLSHHRCRGARVAILTNAGGPGSLPPTRATQPAPAACPQRRHPSALRAFLPAAASVSNPVDMLASAPADHDRRSLPRDPFANELGGKRGGHLHSLSAPGHRARCGRRGHRVEGRRGRHCNSVLRGVHAAPKRRTGGASAACPCHKLPEIGGTCIFRGDYDLRALGRETRSPAALRWIILPRGCEPRDRRRQVLGRGGGLDDRGRVRSLLAAAGIPCAPARVAGGRQPGWQRQPRLLFALKALGPALLHRPSAAPCLLNLSDDAALRGAFDDFSTALRQMTSVAGLAHLGRHMIVGALQDPLFGPLIACGTGGVLVDVLPTASSGCIRSPNRIPLE